MWAEKLRLIEYNTLSGSLFYWVYSVLDRCIKFTLGCYMGNIFQSCPQIAARQDWSQFPRQHIFLTDVWNISFWVSY